MWITITSVVALLWALYMTCVVIKLLHDVEALKTRVYVLEPDNEL